VGKMPCAKALRIVVEGEVQGVGFRGFVKNLAQYFGITGYVRNLEDGSVEIFAEDSEETIARFIEYLKRESPTAIWGIRVFVEMCRGFKDFFIVP